MSDDTLTPRRSMRPICWWFGCSPMFGAEHHGAGNIPCQRCGAEDTTYADQVGDARHHRAVEALKRWTVYPVLRLLPRKCPACGQRTCAPECDGIPF